MFTPCVLTVAGSDSGGGAGIQADLKTITVLGGFGMSALTALTAQNTRGVEASWPVPADFVVRQIEAVASDLPIHAAKTGMLANREIVEAVGDAFRRLEIRPVIVDPVMVAKSGHPLLREDDSRCLAGSLFPLARLITPNLPEASLLAGRPVETDSQLREAARALFDMGPEAVLIKGGHGRGPESADLLYDGHGFTSFPAPRLETPNTHGTGCTYSAAIATFLARAFPLPEAVLLAKRFITDAIRFSLPLGGGHGPTNPYAAAFRDAERFRVLEALKGAAKDLRGRPELNRLFPEVQSNMGYALPFASDATEVAAFPGRIVRLPEGLEPASPAEFGASRHIAGIILAAMRTYPELRAAMNIAFSEQTLRSAGEKDLLAAGFDRTREPDDVKRREGSTLEWGTLEAIRASTHRPDLIFDRGETGKEPMIRILGTDPQDVIRKLLLLV
jgi:hydroxymethylpyrimidine kinase / phosphomethylpyrimidine kinase / thiamine-phosphate diphosphorylase